MQFLFIIFYIAIGYFLLAFVGLRLVAPFMGFRQYAVPVNLPEEIKNKILELERNSKNQKAYLDAVYNFVLNNWHHTRGQAAIMLPKLFLKDSLEIWQTKGFIYCHTMNYIANILIANSKFFKASDVKVKHVFLNFVPHQYLQVRLNNQWVDFDPAGAGVRGFLVGKHMSFFG